MKSIGIYNNKGGCGKSSVTINLAYEFAKTSSVLVIDTDGQSNTSRFFLDEPKAGLEKVLLGKGKMPKAEETRYSNIFIISATAAVNNTLGKFGEFPEKRQCEIANEIVNSNSEYDYVIVDLPPAMNTVTKRIIGACDYVFVPIELGTFAIQGIPKVTSVITDCSAKLGGVFVNKFDKKNRADISLLQMLSQQLGNKALQTCIPYSKVIKNSISYKSTAQEYMGWTAAAKAFEALAAEIKERIG